MSSLENIRNFCIIAHIDHGKSTLADRLLELTGTMSKREITHGQMLDMMDLEQERGITIKLQPVRMYYQFGGQVYILNLIDTPGHVDFAYEVSRSLAACEGAILLVDATQGIQAQTLANCYMALEHNLTIIPVLNKIDLASANVDRCKREMEHVLGILKEDIICISAKEGTNIQSVLDKVILNVPHPKPYSSDVETNRALIFDSVYDNYKGVVAYVRVFDGHFKPGDTILLMNTECKAEILEVGYFRPKYQISDCLHIGEVGYIVTGLKNIHDVRVGDTIWSKKSEHGTTSISYVVKPQSLAGYKRIKPVVFAGIYCVDSSQFNLLREALERLSLNDSSLNFEPEQSGALGHGFRCGFLGLLHLEIVQERLEREYNLNLIVTSPSVSYIIEHFDKTDEKIENPSVLPDSTAFNYIKEPWMKLEVVSPKEYIGGIMKLVQDLRGIHKRMEYLDLTRVILEYEIPLSSIVIDFYDELKSLTSGYGSMNYEFLEYRPSDLVKLDVLVCGDKVEAFTHIVHRSESQERGRIIVKKLKDLIPRHQFEIILQAAIGAKIIARETISAYRKDVIAKLYGGDRTRKDKLLKKQKEGKKRMKMVGNVELPQEAFLAVLRKQ